MSKLLNTGISALTASQAALQTTGHNIANVNTAGYSRQTVALQTATAQNMGSGFIGSGVSIATVSRNYSELLNRQSNAASAASAAAIARSQSLNQMQDVFSGGESGLGAAINDMMNAFADLETAPADSSARNVVLTRIAELASRFRAASASLEEQDYATKQQISNDVLLVNSLAGQVAALNVQIARSLASGHQPNDLLDKRDQLIREINQYVKTSQVDADDGTLSLFVAGSQPLVLGATSAQLSVDITQEYPGSGKLSLYFNQGNGQKVELTAAMLGGGEVAGLLQFNNEDLTEGRNQLGRLALAIGSELNQRNSLGLTLNGDPGQKLLALPQAAAGYSNIANFVPGTSAYATFTDTRALVASDYKIVFGANGVSDASLVRISDGVVRPLSSLNLQATGTPPGGNTFTADGLTFHLDAVASSGTEGQSILFQPFNTAANEIKALIYTPDDLAVSSPISASISVDNQGTLQLAKLQAIGGTLPGNNAPITLSFTRQTDGSVTYASSNGLTGTYISGEPITIDGWEITLAGTPQTGDTVVVRNAKDAELGDSWMRNSGNAAAFLALRDTVIFDKGTTLVDGFSAAMAAIGTRTQSATYAADLAASVATSLENDRTSFSGVNLDEEAARLLQYQQSYQASAKVIQIAQSLFDSVLNAVNR